MLAYGDIGKALEKLPGRLIEVLNHLCFYSLKLGYNIYLVGGTVRDLLLGIDIKDLDVTVEGDAENLAREIWEDTSNKVTYYPRFKTAAVELVDGFSIDLVTARREFYPEPAALPEVAPSDLYHDLFRRDFTINAMAVEIKPDCRGYLVDYFNGLKDLEGRKLRVIHDKSFTDDPTRIFRCIRFKSRYGFEIESRTRELMNRCIKEGLPKLLSTDRIFNEMNLMFGERQPHLAVEIMVDTGLWELLFPGSGITPSTYKKLKMVSRNTEDRDLFAALALLEDSDSPELNTVFSSYSKLVGQLKVLRSRESKFNRQLEYRPLDDYTLYSIYRGIDDKIIEYCMLSASSLCYKENLRRYMKIKDFPFYISGNTVKDLGIPPGPVYRGIIEAARQEILTRGIKDSRGQIEVVRKLVQEGGIKDNGGEFK